MSDEVTKLPTEEAKPTEEFDAEKASAELHAFLEKKHAEEDAIRAEQDPALDEVRSSCDDYRQSLK